MNFLKAGFLLYLASFGGVAYAQDVLAKNEDAFIVSHMRTSVGFHIFSAFTLGIGEILEPSETEKKKKKWAKIIEVARSSQCKFLAVGLATDMDPEIAIRGVVDAGDAPAYLRENGAKLKFSDPYGKGGGWSYVKVGMVSSDTMFICSKKDDELHGSFKSIDNLESDLKLEGYID